MTDENLLSHQFIEDWLSFRARIQLRVVARPLILGEGVDNNQEKFKILRASKLQFPALCK